MPLSSKALAIARGKASWKLGKAHLTPARKQALKKAWAARRKGATKKVSQTSADAQAKAAQLRGRVLTSYEASQAKAGTVKGLHTSWGLVFIKK